MRGIAPTKQETLQIGYFTRRERTPAHAAKVLIKRYGDGAATEAAMRADEFLDEGNMDGQRVWMRIMQAIEELQRERSGDGQAMH